MEAAQRIKLCHAEFMKTTAGVQNESEAVARVGSSAWLDRDKKGKI
jgi:hypothetical protein